jgi:hypothetical protein
MRIGNDSLNIGTNLAVNQTSDPIYLGHIANYSIQLVFTGTPGGNFKLQCSNDMGNPSASKESDRDFQIENWTDVADSAQTISAAGNHTWDVQNAGYRWVRVVWTQTSGSGTLTSARFNVKGI